MLVKLKDIKGFSFKKTPVIIIMLILLYLVLLIPDSTPPLPQLAKKQHFVWDRDSLWAALEAKFMSAKQDKDNLHLNEIDKTIEKINDLIYQYFFSINQVHAVRTC